MAKWRERQKKLRDGELHVITGWFVICGSPIYSLLISSFLIFKNFS